MTLVSPGPNKIRRHAQKHHAETDAAVQRKFVKQAECYYTTGRDKEQRRERMPGNSKQLGRNPTVREGACTRRALQISTLPNDRVSASVSKYKNANGR